MKRMNTKVKRSVHKETVTTTTTRLGQSALESIIVEHLRLDLGLTTFNWDESDLSVTVTSRVTKDEEDREEEIYV